MLIWLSVRVQLALWVELRSIYELVVHPWHSILCFGYMEEILPETDLQVWKRLVVEHFEESSVDVDIYQHLYANKAAHALLFF